MLQITPFVPLAMTMGDVTEHILGLPPPRAMPHGASFPILLPSLRSASDRFVCECRRRDNAASARGPGLRGARSSADRRGPCVAPSDSDGLRGARGRVSTVTCVSDSQDDATRHAANKISGADDVGGHRSRGGLELDVIVMVMVRCASLRVACCVCVYGGRN